MTNIMWFYMIMFPGVIRLDIHKVSVADASTTFTCEGDSTSLSINPVIKVYPEKSSTKLIINETNSVVEIEANTDCVLLHKNLYFVWNKTRSSNVMFLEPLLEEDFISISPVLEEYSNCISSDHCGGTARSNTLTLTEETSGGTYYFITCTIVIDNNDTGNVTQTFTVISERNFAFKDPSEKNSLLGLGLGLGFGVGLTTFATFIIVFLIKVAPLLPPINLCEDKALKTPSSLTLKWNRVERPEHHFVIKYQRTKGRPREWMFTEKINDTRYTVNGLKPNTSYTFIIHAENDCGMSEDSKPLILKTRVLKPICPEDFRCIGVKENEVIVSWKPYRNIKKQEFMLTVYNISEKSKPDKTRQDTKMCIPDTGKKVVTHKVTDLKPGSKYLFELFSAAGKLISERSAIISVETKDSGDVDDGEISKSKDCKVTTVFHFVTHNN